MCNAMMRDAGYVYTVQCTCLSKSPQRNFYNLYRPLSRTMTVLQLTFKSKMQQNVTLKK